MATEADVRRVAMDLPAAYEQPTYDDAPSWRTKPRMFAWIRSDQGVGGRPTLVVWVASVEDRQALIAEKPKTFFTTDHYADAPIVLVRLSTVGRTELTELITESYRLRAPRRLVTQLDG